MAFHSLYEEMPALSARGVDLLAHCAWVYTISVCTPELPDSGA